jgi:ATP/maltotriose-dependent transcriptional regulator MalT
VLWRVRALQELGTIDMFDTLATDRLEEARRTAERVGALSLAAVVDLQLAALYNERGELDAALAAALRCEDASRRWGLATLPMSLAVQAMVHARRGRRADMDAAFAAARSTGQDSQNVEMNALNNAVCVIHIVDGDLAAATAAADASMEAFRSRPGAVAPFPGLWALLRTVLGEGGDVARAETTALPFDTPVSRELLTAADAVALGQAGDSKGAADRFARADAALARQEGGFRQALARLLVAPAAVADGWGEPVEWLRASLALFEDRGLDAFARRCRDLLRDAGAPVPRRGRGDAGTVTPALAALGITSREAEVLALVAAGASNRQVAEQLVISMRTVDKHVERLLAKTGTATRAGLADVAREAGLLRT